MAKKRIMRAFKMTEISGVDRPCQEAARAVITKSEEISQKEQHMTTTKADIHKLISELAEKDRKPGETQEQSYARFIARHPDGEKLYKCYKLAPGPSIIPAAVEVRK